MSNIAGEMVDVLIRRTRTLTCTDTYTAVIPENLTSLREQLQLLYKAWPSGQHGEALILYVALDNAE